MSNNGHRKQSHSFTVPSIPTAGPVTMTFSPADTPPSRQAQVSRSPCCLVCTPPRACMRAPLRGRIPSKSQHLCRLSPPTDAVLRHRSVAVEGLFLSPPFCFLRIPHLWLRGQAVQTRPRSMSQPPLMGTLGAMHAGSTAQCAATCEDVGYGGGASYRPLIPSPLAQHCLAPRSPQNQQISRHQQHSSGQVPALPP